MEVEPIRDMKDVKRVYNWLNENCTPKEAECFLIGCNVALRAGDLLQLRFDQFDGSEFISITERKNGFRKDIPVTDPVLKAVGRLREYYSSQKFYKSKDFNPVYLFQSTSRRAFHLCQPICIQWLSLNFKKAAKELGFDFNFNTHSMRKTWGYHAYQNGEDISYVQALLNHREQHTTLRYIGVTKDYVKKMIVHHQMDLAD